MMSKSKAYWLFKSEPDVFSIDDLAKSSMQTSSWEGVRNYQARNYLRDEVKLGDEVLFYHSRIEPLGIFGVAMVIKEAYVDHFAFDKKSKYFDPKSKPEKPTWYMVDVKFKTKFPKPVTLAMMREHPELAQMKVLQKGNRLSILPVTTEEFRIILELSKS
jgi:predicted RNA-binding protein with PUA-like domain